jgi:hypothetical protein
MALDLALHKGTGDILFSARGDLLTISGPEQTGQRIWIRMKVPRGEWIYDEDGTFGSNLAHVMRGLKIPKNAAYSEIAQAVHEAAAPMADVELTDIEIEELDAQRAVRVVIRFRSLFQDADLSASFSELTQSATIEIPRG